MNHQVYDEIFQLANKACDFEERASYFKSQGDIEASNRLKTHAVEYYERAAGLLLRQKDSTKGKTALVVQEISAFLIGHIESLGIFQGITESKVSDPKKGI